MAKKRTARELWVVFDTNALHTQVPSDFVNAETRDLIQANSKHPDLQIAWHVPEVVVLERHYQMRTKAEQLLRAFQKMDAILGFAIALTPEQLSPRIESVIDSQMGDLKLTKLIVDPARVNWAGLIHDAAFRVAPFQPGDSEKGFRDAVILESFMQLVEGAPKAATTCRLALVTKDELLTEAAKARIGGCANVEVLASLEEVRNLINTLISTVDETFVKELREKARRLFFVPNDEDTFSYRAKVIDKIREKYSIQLAEQPPGAETREVDRILIGSPRFIRKERQRVFWLTLIEFAANAFKYIPTSSVTTTAADVPQGGLGTTIYQINPGMLGLGQMPLGNINTVLSSAQSEKVLVKKGHTDFNVAWSATVDRNKKLVRPKIDDITFVGTTWE